jgi:hypothetical protein
MILGAFTAGLGASEGLASSVLTVAVGSGITTGTDLAGSVTEGISVGAASLGGAAKRPHADPARALFISISDLINSLCRSAFASSLSAFLNAPYV